MRYSKDLKLNVEEKLYIDPWWLINKELLIEVTNYF